MALHGERQRVTAADQHDEASAACDRGVEQIALQEQEVLRVQRHDDRGILASL